MSLFSTSIKVSEDKNLESKNCARQRSYKVKQDFPHHKITWVIVDCGCIWLIKITVQFCNHAFQLGKIVSKSDTFPSSLHAGDNLMNKSKKIQIHWHWIDLGIYYATLWQLQEFPLLSFHLLFCAFVSGVMRLIDLLAPPGWQPCHVPVTH